MTLGGFDGDDLVFVANISTDTSATKDEYSIKILNILNLYGIDTKAIKGAVMSSVVPQLNMTVKSAVKFLIGIDTLTVGPGVKTGISIQCDTPSSVGADLICACVAAHHIYGSPSLIIDMGTATTVSVLDKKGAHIGGCIIPGVKISMDALTERTALLPGLQLDKPKRAIGRNTVDAMRSGIMLGTACMLDGIVNRMEEELGEKVTVIATGGIAKFIVPLCRRPMIYDKDLIIKGLVALYKDNMPKA